MNKIRIGFLGLSLLLLQGCVTGVVAMSCAQNMNNMPQKKQYQIEFEVTLDTSTETMTKSTEMICIYTDRRCGGGDWYFVWEQTAEDDMTFKISDSKEIEVKIPNCTMALKSLDHLEMSGKPFVHGDSVIISNQQEFWVKNSSLYKTEAINVYGLALSSFAFNDVEESAK